MNKRTILYADEGKVLTNGEIYGSVIYLAEDMTAFSFYEITKEEYEKIQEQEREQQLQEVSE